jgi:hypothetical protein
MKELIPFRVSSTQGWNPEFTIPDEQKKRLIRLFGGEQIDGYNFPLPEIPGYQARPDPQFRTRDEFVEYMLERLQELNSLSFVQTKKGADYGQPFSESLSDLILDLLTELESLASGEDEEASMGLVEVAFRATQGLEREVRRGNQSMLEELQYRHDWPIRTSVISSIRTELTALVSENGLGQRIPQDFKGKDHCKAASILTNCLCVYMVENRKIVSQLEAASFFDNVDEEKISPSLKILRKIPKKLTRESWEDWFDASLELLKEATGGLMFKHPVFNQPHLKFFAPSSGLGLNWRKSLRKEWELRACQEFKHSNPP